VGTFGLLNIIVLAGALVRGFGGVTTTEPVPATPVVAEPKQEIRLAPRQAGPDQIRVLLAAGDIARCGEPGAAATAALLRDRPGTVATLGDNAYPAGSKQQFADCYNPTWGVEKARTRPAPGNHEYGMPGASGYFDYFGAAAGDPKTGYYSYDLGAWHIVVLNSNCEEVGGCEADSPEGRWLRKDLAAHPTTCTLAYWHHPLFSSGTEHGGDDAMRPTWQLLYQAGADVVLSGHEHNYERFAPQDPSGEPDPKHGIREFVVGTGGASHYPFGQSLPTSEIRNADTYGVLALTLRPTGYDWTFVPADSVGGGPDGKAFTDSGSAACH
jgi:acid phosphatase type 7